MRRGMNHVPYLVLRMRFQENTHRHTEGKGWMGRAGQDLNHIPNSCLKAGSGWPSQGSQTLSPKPYLKVCSG